MNGISKGKKLISSPDGGVRFKTFATAEKARLRTAYPFLSSSQINGKIKEKWKLLDHREKYSYSKVVHKKVTPSKGKSTKSTKKSPKRQEKCKFDVGDTPEYVNLYRLSDFRKQHAESYRNDFSFDESTIQPGKNGGSVLFGKSHDVLLDGFREGNNAAEEMDTGDAETLESDEENDGVLIRRTDFEYNDGMGSTVVDKELDNTISRSVDRLDKEERRNTSVERENNMKETEHEVVRNESDIHYNENKKVTNKSRNNITDIALFKSPNPLGSATKKCSGRKSRPSVPSNPETLSLSSNMPEVLTPQVSNSNEETEKYTTPQMDEVLQKLTINEVNKAPTKRRYSHESADYIKKVKAAVSGRRVTRSLLALQSEVCEDAKENLEVETGESGNVTVNESYNKDFKDIGKKTSRLSLKKKKKLKLKGANKNIGKDETGIQIGDSFKETGMNIEAVKLKVANEFETRKKFDENMVEMNPTGDARQVDTEIKDIDGVNFSLKTGFGGGNKGDNKIRHKRKSNFNESGQNGKMQKREATTPSEITGSRVTSAEKIGNKDNFSSSSSSVNSRRGTQSSVDFGSSPASSLRSLTPRRKSYSNTVSSNPALEKVLQSLRSTRVTSPTWSCSNSSVSSPRLLSPALSGVSEFSSLSDQRSINQQESDDAEMSLNTAKASGLCDMFNDITPPECKTKGLYKTTRMVTSGKQDDSSDFKQLFQEERDNLFC